MCRKSYCKNTFYWYNITRGVSQVKWRPVIGGCLVQLLFALLVLRFKPAFEGFKVMGDVVQTFINKVDVGVEFLFGKSFSDHFFAFKVLSIIIYFSGLISLLYHIGFMQKVIRVIAWFMQKAIGTSAPESMVGAGDV